jgi:hypothetical protein
MDLAKLVSLLDRHALFFAAAASLGDRFEGSLPAANLPMRPAWYGAYQDKIEPQAKAMRLQALRQTLISCWHINDSESEAMWRLYTPFGLGIAVQSTYGSMTGAFMTQEPIFVGQVRYLNYENDPVAEGNVFAPFLTKRVSFAHELELRAVAWREDAPADFGGDYIPVDLVTLIREVRVAPGVQAWFLDAVQAVALRFGLEAPVLPSAMDGNPIY